MLQERLKQRELDVALDGIMLYILVHALTLHLGANEVSGDLSIAIAMADARTFTWPVLHNLGHKRLGGIVRELDTFAARVRSDSLAPSDLNGARFAYVNLGAYGIDTYALPRSPRGVPVLGLGRIRRTAAGPAMVWLQLSFDGNTLDALTAVRLIQSVAHLMEDPDLLL